MYKADTQQRRTQVGGTILYATVTGEGGSG